MRILTVTLGLLASLLFCHSLCPDLHWVQSCLLTATWSTWLLCIVLCCSNTISISFSIRVLQFKIFFSLCDIGDFWLWISFSITLPLSSKCKNIKMGPLIRKLSPQNQTHLSECLYGKSTLSLYGACHSAKCVTTYGPPCTLYITKYLTTVAYLKCTCIHKQTTKCDNHYWWFNNARCSISIDKLDWSLALSVFSPKTLDTLPIWISEYLLGVLMFTTIELSSLWVFEQKLMTSEIRL